MTGQNTSLSRVILGDCTEVLRDLARDGFLVDAVVTDPPYHFASIVSRLGSPDAAPIQSGQTGAYARASKGFMGQEWDGGDVAFRVDTWRRVFDVMKPGAHLIAFAATKGYHRMVCAIEDAGFEIKDMIPWLYATGFPKSHNISKIMREHGKVCCCEDEDLRDMPTGVGSEGSVSGIAQSDLRAKLHGEAGFHSGEGTSPETENASRGELRGVRPGEGNSAGVAKEGKKPHLQSSVQRSPEGEGLGQTRPQGSGGTNDLERDERSGQSCLEGRGDTQAPKGELQGGPLCQGPGMGEVDVTKGRVHHGTQASDGPDVRLSADQGGSGQSHRPQSLQQSSEQSRTLADERRPQARRGGEICPRCRKPMFSEGLGTALKPAIEPVVLAQKPISETSIEANVLRWGVGAININACRIPIDDDQYARNCSGRRGHDQNRDRSMNFHLTAGNGSDLGRFPANICHDGSAEVLEAFAEYGERGAIAPVHTRSADKFRSTYGEFKGNVDEGGSTFRADSGTAARFFYSSKATQGERVFECKVCGQHKLGKLDCGHDEFRTHPTVKPISLMRWFVEMVTPPGGLVLDPFAGTGTTGAAAREAGVQSLMIEASENHVRDIGVRLGISVEDLLSAKVEAAQCSHGDQIDMFL